MKKPLMLAAALVVAFATLGFTPFTPVKNVCPECKQAPSDVVTLSSGETLRAQVIGENPSFYVVVRYGEARAIPRNEVRGIEWASGSKPPNVTSSDHILLKNGVVFAGNIVEDKAKPPLIQLKSNWTDQTYVIFKSEVQEAYRSGVKMDL